MVWVVGVGDQAPKGRPRYLVSLCSELSFGSDFIGVLSTYSVFLKGVFEQQRSVGGGEGDLDDTGEGVLGLHRPACSAGEGDGEGVGSGVLWRY